MRGAFSVRCARAASGQVAIVPSSVMKSRRLIGRPRRGPKLPHRQISGTLCTLANLVADVAVGSKTEAVQLNGMSALPSTTDMQRLRRLSAKCHKRSFGFND